MPDYKNRRTPTHQDRINREVDETLGRIVAIVDEMDVYARATPILAQSVEELKKEMEALAAGVAKIEEHVTELRIATNFVKSARQVFIALTTAAVIGGAALLLQVGRQSTPPPPTNEHLVKEVLKAIRQQDPKNKP